MACKRPVVATNVGGIPEILNDRCGVLVAHETYLRCARCESLLAESDTSETISQPRLYAAVREALTWDNIARRTEKAYSNALADGELAVVNQGLRAFL